MQQPVFGVVLTGTCLILALVATCVGVGLLSIEPLMLLLLAVCWLFGVMVIMTMFQMWPGRLFKQPFRGTVNIALGVGPGVLGYFDYKVFAAWRFGTGMQKYPVDVFTLTTMMLGVTFPALAAYCDFFDFWSLPPAPVPPERA